MSSSSRNEWRSSKIRSIHSGCLLFLTDLEHNSVRGRSGRLLGPEQIHPLDICGLYAFILFNLKMLCLSILLFLTGPFVHPGSEEI